MDIENADGRYPTLPFVRAHPKWEAADFRKEAEKRAGRELGPSEVSAFWFRQGFDWIKSNPKQAFSLWLHKARLMIHQFEIADNYSLYLARSLFVPTGNGDTLTIPRQAAGSTGGARRDPNGQGGRCEDLLSGYWRRRFRTT